MCKGKDKWKLIIVILAAAAAIAAIVGYFAVPEAAVMVAPLCAILLLLIISENRKNLAAKDTEILYREELFGLLLKNLDDAFLMINADDYSPVYVSHNVKRLLGIDDRKMRFDIRLLDELAAGPDTVRILEKLPEIGLGEHKQYEREYIHAKTGEYRWFLVTIYHAKLNGEEKYVAVLSDRTKEKNMNQTLKNALDVARSANQAKSNFLANMSHDIRTPMNAIMGFSALLQKYGDNPDKVREYTGKIISSGEHLLSLINDVLDMSKIESGRTSLHLAEFSLGELFEGVYSIIIPQIRTKKLCFEMRSMGVLPECLIGDKQRLIQILLNLLSNAVKYTPEGGTVILTVEGKKIESRGMAHICFRVSDNGYGISEDFLSKVFEPFARETDERIKGIQGTGLGLPITKNIVELMGGTISVKSAPDKGSTFTVDLELQTAEERPGREFWKKHGIKRLLIADDQEEVCVNVREIMSETGVEVDCAVGGSEAVRMAEAAAEIHEDYHVIILDWKMSDLDGIEAARQIREKVGTEVPIMILAAYDFEDIKDEAEKAGISGFMPKPFFISNLRRIVEEHHRKKNKMPDPGSLQVQHGDRCGVFEGMHVLAAEDNESNAEIITELLKTEGITCDIAENGKEAVERFTKAEPGYYDMIFMDIQMPVMDGYEATRCIRESGHPDAKTVPIVAMTAYAFEEDVRRALEAGMNAHTAKPVNMEKLKELMLRLTGKE